MDSFGSQFYSKAMECLKTLRQESINVIFHFFFNYSFLAIEIGGKL